MPRKGGPWWRTERGQWFASVRGRQYPLGVTDPADRAGAEAAYRALVDQLAEAGGPAEQLFAWAVTGLTALGDPACAKGFLTAENEDAAVAELTRRFHESQRQLGAEAPRLKLMLNVWQLPLPAVVDVLRANGYTIIAPRGG